MRESEWNEKAIGDVLTLEYGKPLPPSSRGANGQYAVYGANGIKDRSDLFYVDKPSIIVGRKGSAGEITLTEDKFWPLDVTYYVTFDEALYDLQFLYYLLSLQDLKKLARGVKPGINRNEVYAKKVRIPSLSEQQRVVAILDDTFAGMAIAIANAEKNLRNAKELFESGLKAALSPKGEGWKSQRLEDVVAKQCTLSYGIVQPGDEKLEGLPIVRPVDLTTKVIRIENLKRIDPSLAESYKRTQLIGGELLLCVRGSTGELSIASEELSGANVTRGIVPILFDRSQVTQRFGYYALRSEPMQRQIREKTYGTALMQINIRDVRNLLICVPSLATQDQIAETLDKLYEDTLRLQNAYRSKLSSLEELKQALLQKALTGELGPTISNVKEAAE